MSPVGRVSLVYIVYFTAVGAAWPYLPVYYREVGLGLETIGLLAALGAATQLVAAPAWGALTDRFRHTRLTLPLAALVAAGGATTLVAAQGLGMTAAAVLVLSAGLAGVGTILDSRAIETLGSERARFGQICAWGSVAFVVVALAVGILIDQIGTSGLFGVYVPALLLTAVASLALARRETRSGVRVPIIAGALVLVRERRMALFLLGTMLVWTILTAVNAFYSIRIIALGGPAGTVGLAWVIGAAVEVPIMWGYGRLAGRFGTQRLLVLGAALFAVRSAASAIAPDAVTLVAISPIEGAAFGLFYVGGVNFVASRAPDGLAATAQGVFSATGGLAQIVGAGLGGVGAAALGIPGLFGAAAVGGAAAAAVVAVAVRGSAPDRRPAGG